MKNKLILNKERGIWVAHQAVEMLHNKKFPFNRDDVIPEVLLPKNVEPGSLDQALLIFYGVTLDSKRNAAVLYKAVRGMVEEGGAQNILHMEGPDLARLVNDYIGGGPDDPIRTILSNNDTLLKKYDGDPRNIFKGAKTIDEMIKMATKFKQFGPGKATLLLKNYVKLGFAKVKNRYDLPIKVDRHVIRISFGTGAIRLESEEKYKTAPILKALRNFYREITREERIDPCELNDALWVIGSKLCTKRNYSKCQKNECYLLSHCKKLSWMDNYGDTVDPSNNVRKETGQGYLF